MIMSINLVIVTGNLTREPELRNTQSGFSVLNFSIAVNENKKVNGEWQSTPNFFDCVMLGERAETWAKKLSKGCGVTIQGHLKQQTWERDGQKRSKVEINVDKVEVMRGGSNVSPQVAYAAQQAQAATQRDIPSTVYDSDIPF